MRAWLLKNLAISIAPISFFGTITTSRIRERICDFGIGLKKKKIGNRFFIFLLKIHRQSS
jgi:hypothetical protein